MANSKMKEAIILDWTFTPPDYFEETVRIVRDNNEMTLDKGKVKATIDAQYFDNEPDFHLKLHESLNSRFLAAQILSQKPFELSEPSMSRIYPDGRIDKYLHAQPIKFKWFSSILCG
jgi:hypothetical protein